MQQISIFIEFTISLELTDLFSGFQKKLLDLLKLKKKLLVFIWFYAWLDRKIFNNCCQIKYQYIHHIPVTVNTLISKVTDLGKQ